MLMSACAGSSVAARHGVSGSSRADAEPARVAAPSGSYRHEATSATGPQNTTEATPRSVDATLAVRTHVQVDGALAGSSGVVEDRTRELIERHPALTTDVRAARDAGLSVLALDAVTSCSVTEESGQLEVECGARYSVADERGKLLSTWERSVELSGPLGDSREALLRIAVSHALEGLPARVLSTCSSFECTERPSVANAGW